MMTEAESTGEKFFLDLYSQVGEFRPEEVDAGLLETNEGPRIYRAFVPGSSQPADCAILYMIYTEEYEPLKFLTVEISPEVNPAASSFGVMLSVPIACDT